MEMREAALGAFLGEARNILVRPDDHTDQAAICNWFFEGECPPRAVVVSYEQSVEDWLADTQRSALNAVAFVSVGEPIRSTTATTTPTDTMSPAGPNERVRIDGVGDPTDLAALGLTIHAHLESLQEAASGEVVVCFDSLSALLEAVSLRQAFRFLHTLTNLIRACDATAHYHADDRLTAQELETLRPLYDAEFSSQHSHDPGLWCLESTTRRLADEEDNL